MFITVKDLSKEFKVKIKRNMFQSTTTIKKAVNNISFNIEKGETIAFIGPNGAGKSTTIKMLTGIIRPSFGCIEVAGLSPVTDRKQLAYKIGCMFGQKSQLYLHLSVIDSFKLLANIYDIKSSEIDDRINYIADLFKIQDLLHLTVRKLSLGQRMICEIAGSILHKPEIIFLDEPTIGLDVIAKHRIREIIKMLNEKENVTVFLTSHDANDVDAICKRMIVIDHGSVVIDSSTDDLKREFLVKKKVIIHYDTSIQNVDFNRELLRKEEFFIEFVIDTKKEKIASVLKDLISLGEVSDIQIEETPMEEIIKNIYEERIKND